MGQSPKMFSSAVPGEVSRCHVFVCALQGREVVDEADQLLETGFPPREWGKIPSLKCFCCSGGRRSAFSLIHAA